MCYLIMSNYGLYKTLSTKALTISLDNLLQCSLAHTSCVPFVYVEYEITSSLYESTQRFPFPTGIPVFSVVQQQIHQPANC